MLLFSVVATWNNYFLPLIMLKRPELVPADGRAEHQWNAQATARGGHAVFNLVITGSLSRSSR